MARLTAFLAGFLRAATCCNAADKAAPHGKAPQFARSRERAKSETVRAPITSSRPRTPIRQTSAASDDGFAGPRHERPPTSHGCGATRTFRRVVPQHSRITLPEWTIRRLTNDKCAIYARSLKPVSPRLGKKETSAKISFAMEFAALP